MSWKTKFHPPLARTIAIIALSRAVRMGEGARQGG